MTLYELLNPKKEYLKGKKALIFDMDGTLIDSMAYWRANAGDDMSKYNSLIDYLYEKYNTVIEPKKHAIEFLQLLHENKIPVCIASDTPRELSKGFFKRHPYFDDLIEFYAGSENVGVYKYESPKIYEYAAEKLGFKKEECLVFEDNMSSVLSAEKAGFDVVGVYDLQNESNTEIIKKHSVDYILDFSEMFKK